MVFQSVCLQVAARILPVTNIMSASYLYKPSIRKKHNSDPYKKNHINYFYLIKNRKRNIYKLYKVVRFLPLFPYVSVH